jgi:DNA-binding XRE family transcriptional regulator
MRLVDTYGWDAVQLSIRLHVIRLRCNLTQEELAYRAGISRNTIVKLESCGDTKLSTIVALSNAMRMPMHAWFLPEDEWRKWYDFNIPQDTP